MSPQHSESKEQGKELEKMKKVLDMIPYQIFQRKATAISNDLQGWPLDLPLWKQGLQRFALLLCRQVAN